MHLNTRGRPGYEAHSHSGLLAQQRGQQPAGVPSVVVHVSHVPRVVARVDGANRLGVLDFDQRAASAAISVLRAQVG